MTGQAVVQTNGTTSDVPVAAQRVRDSSGQPNAVCDGPGQALRAVAEKLAAHGFDVDGSEGEEARWVRVTGLRGTACDITVNGSGILTWEYLPGGSADSDMVAGRALHLLTGRPPLPARRPGPGPEPRTGLKSLVGSKLAARGMTVRLEIFEDRAPSGVPAGILVANPRHPERGRVHVADDGALIWECDSGEHGIGAGAMVDVIAAIVSGDIGHGCVERSGPTLGGRP